MLTLRPFHNVVSNKVTVPFLRNFFGGGGRGGGATQTFFVDTCRENFERQRLAEARRKGVLTTLN